MGRPALGLSLGGLGLAAMLAATAHAGTDPAATVTVVATSCVDQVVDVEQMIEILRVELRSGAAVRLERGSAGAGEGAIELGCGDAAGEVVIRRDRERTAVSLADVAGEGRPRVLAIALAAELAVPVPPPSAPVRRTVAPGAVVRAPAAPLPPAAERGRWSASLRFEGLALADSGAFAGGTVMLSRTGERVSIHATATAFFDESGSGAVLGGPRLGLRGPSVGRFGVDIELGLELGGTWADGPLEPAAAGVAAVVGRYELSPLWDVGAQLSYRRSDLGGGDLIAIGLSATRFFR